MRHGLLNYSVFDSAACGSTILRTPFTVDACCKSAPFAASRHFIYTLKTARLNLNEEER